MPDKQNMPEIRFRDYREPWTECKLSSCADFLTGNGYSWNDINLNGNKECILYGNLYTDYGMIIENIKFKTNTDIKNPIYSKNGDVLIPASDTTPMGLARAACIEKSGVLLGGDINILRPYNDINGSYLSLVINANKKELIKLIKGITVRHIHNSDIKNIKIMISPYIEEQRKIVLYFKKIEYLINIQQEKLDKLKNIKKTMLDKMFV